MRHAVAHSGAAAHSRLLACYTVNTGRLRLECDGTRA